MKKIIALTIAIIALTFAAQAQNDRNNVTITEQQVKLSGDNVSVSFRIHAGKRVVRSGRTLIYEPVLTDGTNSWSLPPVVVRGKGARIAESRHDWADGNPVRYENVKYLERGGAMHYTAVIPWQIWMNGADLLVESLEMGCCATTGQNPQLIAGNLNLPSTQKPVVDTVVRISYENVPRTTGDRMVAVNTYFRPAAEFEKLTPGKLFDEDRKESLTIYYKVGSSVIDMSLEDNYNAITNMIVSIKQIQASSDSRIAHVVVAGFASPEGSFDLNDRLAWDRALAVKKHIMKFTGINGDKVHLYNGSEDWRGLRLLVEKSDMYNKQKALDIIDNVPIWDPVRRIGRESELKRLDGGRTYRYMVQHFYPLLRNAAYIKVYYENTDE